MRVKADNMRITIFIFYLLFLMSKLFSQSKVLIPYDDRVYEIYSYENEKILYFYAESQYLAISGPGLNHIELKQGSENGVTIPYYEKLSCSLNTDFLYENLIVGQPYYIVLKPHFFEKNKAGIALTKMEKKLPPKKLGKIVKPFHHAVAVEYQNAKQIKN